MTKRAALATGIVVTGWALAVIAAEPRAAALTLRYDVQVAWIQAGEIAMQFTQTGDRYALSGTVATSPFMDRLFKWRGRFVATGRFHGDVPHSDTYLLWGSDGEREERSITFGGRTVITTSRGESRDIPQPPGSDFMSVTFLAPHCLVDTTLHDGEDLYHLQLVRASDETLALRPPYYADATQRCDYKFRYDDGSIRRVSLWMGYWQGRRLPVRVRVRIPLLPDGVMHLRTEER